MSIASGFAVNPPLPPMVPLSVEVPWPAKVSVFTPRLMELATWLTGAVMVRPPAGATRAMPPNPSESVFVPLPDWMRTPPVLSTRSPAAAWGAFKLTVCGVLTVMMLKSARSEAPGGAAGSGVAAFWSVDQELATFQPVPVPSQDRVAAGERYAESATTDKASAAKRILSTEARFMVGTSCQGVARKFDGRYFNDELKRFQRNQGSSYLFTDLAPSRASETDATATE